MKYPIGTKVMVQDEYRDDDESRTLPAVVIGHEYNKDYKYTDNIIKFTDGAVLPFGDHEIEAI